MPEEKDEDIDSKNDAADQTDDEKNLDDTKDDDADDADDADDDDSDDVDALKEKNKQLYARAKKAEGFVLKDGKWVKKEKPAPKVEADKPKAPAKGEVDDALVDSKVQAALDKRDLDAMEVDDDIKTEIKNYAKLHKVSVQVAANSSYIKFMKGEADKKARSDEAAAGTKRKSPSKSDYKDASPDQFDLSTEQGRKDWASYKEWLRTQ